ncbi:hypothetical protein ABIE63_002763 [Limibacillus sp. MBR-115]
MCGRASGKQALGISARRMSFELILRCLNKERFSCAQDEVGAAFSAEVNFKKGLAERLNESPS